MRTDLPQTIRLADYTPFAWQVESVSLTFRLAPTATRVLSEIRFSPREGAQPGAFFLHGEGLRLIACAIDGAAVEPTLTDQGLTCPVPTGPFTFTSEVEINPEANTSLNGLYMSNGMYCSQCEAEGFRRITYYPDRPDVLAPFEVRIEGEAPVLLSNGNPTGSGKGWATWVDPWPKPSYLFALVAGDLVAHSDRFTTSEGRDVALNIWVRPGDEGKCAYAMDALKRSMTWDEEVYGRAYDLDVFNIVAVDDFNMGAMENKGLNIFNSKYVLASPETATDRDFELIEGIIAHEYFHNWTGNRITCRDWFQLCLKEGLTVYRDQQFSGDMRGHAVNRIDNVLALRARQFREDAGPLAHPVRPESYIEINNFYTATVYEKGAELIGMLRALVGDEGYAKALDLYFTRHDGEAATIEDWLKVFEDATGEDLTQFARWYSQAGTPTVTASTQFDEGVFSLTLKQHTAPTPGQPDKEPQVIPVAVGLLDSNGNEAVPTQVLNLNKTEQTFDFKGFINEPTPSILRGFSAPVVLEIEQSTETRAFLLANDTDPFNRWEAGRQLTRQTLIEALDGAPPRPELAAGLGRVLSDESLDPAFRALVLSLPGIDDIAQSLYDAGRTPDPTAIYIARKGVAQSLAAALEQPLGQAYEAMQTPGPYQPTAQDAGKRALRGAALGFLSHLDAGARAAELFAASANMTETTTALAQLIAQGTGAAQISAFAADWSHDRLVMDKWFALQTSACPPEQAAETARNLTEHPDFDWKNPNRFRSVFGGLMANTAGFHDATGDAYTLLADWLIKLDPVNPQTTARMTTAFETWRRYDADRQGMMKEALERIKATKGLSRDTSEMVNRLLA
ncbi:aminopeptidase N [Alphaproteobacteria bacterium KMM 3653]|uniref:Aminopeptidase N n=1 Tax=Harenicola maris TaxID=2841044 RepID=A0AAP2CRB0_9RHOB|nr:aminopeptidase N [Harenicola maris]